MSTDKIQALISDKSGYKITVSKNTGSMKHWTTFAIVAPLKDPENVKAFSWELRQAIKAMFPAVNSQTGCFASQYQFDILNSYLHH